MMEPVVSCAVCDSKLFYSALMCMRPQNTILNEEDYPKMKYNIIQHNN